MTKQLIENIINEYKQEPAYYNSPDGLRSLLEKYLPQQEECNACYGKGKYSVYKGDKVAGVDFPGDKPFLVAKGGVKEFPCPKCNGKVEQEEPKQIDELKKEIEQAQRSGENWTAIWAIYDSLLSKTNDD